MSVTSGFFNSLNHDRRYNAQQFSALFDGIINDGVFANIGVAFAIKADTGVTITIGKGKAWFNSAWVYNDSLLPKTLEGSEVVLDRIDAVVIEVDHSEAVRLGDIKIVKGTPSSSPQRPAMANTANKHQHPLAYIYRKAGSTVITQADITNMVGTSSCPYITGILQVQNIDNIVAQWEAQWNQWYAEKVSDTNSDSSELLADMKSDFDIWFADVKALLDDNVATELAGKVAELQGKFDDLAREGAVYDTLEDADLDVILGSDGTPIQGKTVFAGTDIDLSGYVKSKELAEVKDDLDALAVAKLNRNEKFVRNLLDNSYWKNPKEIVNQRGETEYISHGYTIDRWMLWSANEDGRLTVHDGYVSFNGGAGGGSLSQLFEYGVLDSNKTYTMALLSNTGKLVVSPASITYNYMGIGDLVTICANQNKTDRFEWAALYEGEYTAETLPEYQPKGYGAELAECMQYQLVFKPQVINGQVWHAPIGTGISCGDGRVEIDVHLPVPLRKGVIPTLVAAGSVHLWDGIDSIPIASTSVASISDNTVRIVFIPSTPVTFYRSYTIAALNIAPYGYFIIDANL